MLKGNLAEFPLGTLIQTLAAADRSGALLITPLWFKGKVILKNGALYAAYAGKKEGWQAMELLAGLQDAPFMFDSQHQLPRRANIDMPLETALARLLSVVDRWKSFEHIPKDWSLSVYLSRDSGELQLTKTMLNVLGMVGDNSIAQILEESNTSPLDTAEALNKLIADGILQLNAPTSIQDETLVALSFYGNKTGIVYLDEDLYEAWARMLPHSFAVKIRSPRGVEAKFEARPRPGIPGRIMMNDKDLRRIKAARGIKLQVRLELKGVAE